MYKEFFKRVRLRIYSNNQNWLGIITGDTGSGKSYSALTIAKEISNKIYVVFTAREFMELLNSEDLEKGSVIIFDEAGVGLSSRDWYSQQNKLLGAILQTFRNMNLAVIFTTPDLSFIDVQARKLFHHYFETCGIDRVRNLAKLKIFRIQSSGRTGKTYFKYLSYLHNGHYYTTKGILVKKPDEKTILYYEGLKTAYTFKLNKDALAELDGSKLSKQEVYESNKKDSIAKAEQTITDNKEVYTKVYNKRKFLDVNMIRNEFGLSNSAAVGIKSKLEKTLLH